MIYEEWFNDNFKKTELDVKNTKIISIF